MTTNLTMYRAQPLLLILQTDHNRVDPSSHAPTATTAAYTLPLLFAKRSFGAIGSGWLSLRLNKEPPDDVPVVQFIGVGEPNSSASPRQLANITRSESVSRGSESNRGAGGCQLNMMMIEKEKDGNLEEIKNSGSLNEDDNCIICSPGKVWGGQSVVLQRRPYDKQPFVFRPKGRRHPCWLVCGACLRCVCVESVSRSVDRADR